MPTYHVAPDSSYWEYCSLFWVGSEHPYIAEACVIHGTQPAPLVYLLHTLSLGWEWGLGLQRDVCSPLPCVRDQLAMEGEHTLQTLIFLNHFFQRKALFRPALDVLSPPWRPGAHGCFGRLTSVGSSFWQEAPLHSLPSSMWWKSSPGE